MDPLLVTGPAGSGTTLMYQILQRNIFSSFEDYTGEVHYGINYHLSLPHQIPFEWVDPCAFRGYKKIVMIRNQMDTVYSSWRRFYRNYPGGPKTVEDAMDDYVRASGYLSKLREEEPDRVLNVFYSVIAGKPKLCPRFVNDQIGRLCDFLGVPGLSPMGIELKFKEDAWKESPEFVDKTDGGAKLVHKLFHPLRS